MSDVLILPMPSVSLVFGLDWLPLINGAANRVVGRMARQYRATHMVFAGDAAAAVGFAVLKPIRARSKKALNSAAQNVAQLFGQGTVAVLLELAPTRFWLAAVHDGTVVARTDRLYASRSDAVAALAELQQAYPQLVALGAPGASSAPTLVDIEAASIRQTQLVLLSRWRSVLPAPVQWFLLSLMIALLAPKFWHAFHRVHTAPLALESVDPMLAWREAVARVSRITEVHGIEGTRQVLRSLHELPAYLAGWTLIQADCTARDGIWTCQARYDRRHQEASNAGFLAGAAEGWTVVFGSIDQARLTWRVKSTGLALAGLNLASVAHNERVFFSSLQRIKPAFTQIEVGKSQALNVSPPLDRHGKPIQKPASAPVFMTRSVRVAGPLRSASLLLPHTASIGWQKISLALSDTELVGLKTSRLIVSFQGVLYETRIGHGRGVGRVAHAAN